MTGTGDQRASAPGVTPQHDVPLPTARRLPAYYRALGALEWSRRGSGGRVSSETLAELTGFGAAQVRRDLAHFGSFGTRGAGYDVVDLRRGLKAILGLDRAWNLALVGVGNLGAALLGHRGFAARGFRIVAAFDRDPARHGERVGGLSVRPMDELARVASREGVAIGVLAVPERGAQEAADAVVRAGIPGILNFSPAKLALPPNVHVVDADVTVQLDHLAYLLTRGGAPSRGA